MMSTFATAASSIARTARATESSGVVAKGRLASAMRRRDMFPVYDLVAPSRHHDARCVAVIAGCTRCREYRHTVDDSDAGAALNTRNDAVVRRPFLRGSVGIAMREGVERGFRLPRHVAMSPNDYGTLAVEHLDDAAARKVEVLARVAAMRQIVARERVHERAVDPLALEDLQ